jgi:hypothetical protein
MVASQTEMAVRIDENIDEVCSLQAQQLKLTSSQPEAPACAVHVSWQ